MSKNYARFRIFFGMSKNCADLLDYFATTADWRCSFAGFSNAENSTADNTKA